MAIYCFPFITRYHKNVLVELERTYYTATPPNAFWKAWREDNLFKYDLRVGWESNQPNKFAMNNVQPT